VRGARDIGHVEIDVVMAHLLRLCSPEISSVPPAPNA
jgi:hypothetical protein